MQWLCISWLLQTLCGWPCVCSVDENFEEFECTRVNTTVWLGTLLIFFPPFLSFVYIGNRIDSSTNLTSLGTTIPVRNGAVLDLNFTAIRTSQAGRYRCDADVYTTRSGNITLFEQFSFNVKRELSKVLFSLSVQGVWHMGYVHNNSFNYHILLLYRCVQILGYIVGSIL